LTTSDAIRRFAAPLLLIALAAGPAAAGSYDVFGTGPRAIALGGAYAAIADDISALYYNVAGLAQIDRLQLEVNYAAGESSLTINGRAQDIDPHRGTTFGGVIATEILSRRLALGLNLFVPDDHFMRFLVMSTNQPHSALSHNANHTFTLLSGASYGIFDWLMAGVGVQILATERGGIDFTINEKEPSEGAVFSNLSPTYAALAGIWLKPLDWLRVGASFRDKVEMNIELPNIIHIPPLTLFTDSGVAILRESTLNLIAISNSHFSPRTYTLGVAVAPEKHIQFSADGNFAQWSDMRADAPYASAFVAGGLADVFPTEPGKWPDPPNFHDTWNFGVGVEGRPLLTEHWRVACRGGYRLRPTPVPEQRHMNNYLDNDAHLFSIGVGGEGSKLSAYLPRSFSLDAFLQYQYSPVRVYHKAAAYDFISDLEFQQTWLFGGGGLSMRF
jgi:long-chain fatty acid transport protein